ncbi:2'-5' RNA ligase family protein [Sphingomonas canadensis]|uniref:2'-5' RNA ligase family protein n=1 Tax=Sphingomonas canadensis TaxID=1219257 RepID=A0ABW3H561_9SPHN|nr:2'-5' RNA ligase family protein [Sphingomonas canadensis]MCW3835551.1 2'-5' RNA ligase family protein [Sphingomonas canadensis]
MEPERPAPLIVTALFGSEDFARLDALRRRYYPAAHNVVPAHCTMFSHLPPSAAAEVKRRLAGETRGVKPPQARLSGLMDLNDGVAIRIESPGLLAIRARLAEALAGLLGPTDSAGWAPHVTIQNNVPRMTAIATRTELAATFEPRPLAIAGLAAWWYRGGPWEPLSRHMFG